MTIPSVNPSSISTQDIYNDIADTVSLIMAKSPSGYGRDSSAIIGVTNTSTITAPEWQTLYYETNQIYQHITGNPINFQGVFPFRGNLLTYDFVSTITWALETATDPALTYTAATNQLASVAIQDTSNPIWEGTMQSVVNISFMDLASTQYYFNLGGKIQSSLSFSQVFPGFLEDRWIALILEMQSLMEAHPYDRSLYLLGTPQTFYAGNSDPAQDHIRLTYTLVSPTEITVTVVFNVDNIGLDADSNQPKGLKIKHRVDAYYSVGILPGPKPLSLSVTTGLLQGGQSMIPIVGIITANVASLDYNIYRYEETDPQTVTLTNSSYSTRIVKFYGIRPSNLNSNAGPIAQFYQTGTRIPFTIDVDEPLSLAPGESVSFDLTYISTALGFFNTFLVISTDADENYGFVAIKAPLNVKGPLFRAAMVANPDPLLITSIHAQSEQFNISTTRFVALNYYTITSYSLLYNGVDIGTNPAIFTVSYMMGGPLVTFNPEGFILQPGRPTTGVVTATVTVDCVSVSVPGAPSQHVTTSTSITMLIDISENEHIGHWLSPASLDNSVVGMSYDFIGTYFYLTIGISASDNLLTNSQLTYPLPSAIADADYNFNYANLSFGPDSDTQWIKGIPLFKVQKPDWAAGDAITDFLYTYGVWFTADGSNPRNKTLGRVYNIDIPADGTYNYRFAADLIGYFTIDGDIIADTRNAASEDQARQGFTGQIRLAQGKHTLAVVAANGFVPTDSNPNALTGFALNIVQDQTNLSIWNTLVPVRQKEVYLGWNEVCRIPLPSIGTGVPQTYYSGDYVIKDTGAVFGAFRIQTFFYSASVGGNGSLFKIDDDGSGNLTITTKFKTILSGDASSDQTLSQLQYVSYYYNNLDFDSPGGQSFSSHARRLRNLDPGPVGNGHVTRQFIGFKDDGTVRTQLVRYPGDEGFDPIPRYYIGSLRLGTPGGGDGSNADPRALNIVQSIEKFLGLGFLIPITGMLSKAVGQLWHGITGVIESIPIVGTIFKFAEDVVTAILDPIGDALAGIGHAVFSCFDPDALVTMWDGCKKKIKDVQVGDKVKGHASINTVIGIETPRLGLRSLYKFNDRPVFVSGEHRILTTTGWCAFDPEDPAVEKASTEEIGKIKIGTEIITSSGIETVYRIETETRPSDYTLYNLVVDGDHTYIVEDVVTVNRGCFMMAAICEYYGSQPHDWYEMEMIRLLRDQYVLSRPELTGILDIYYVTTTSIVEQINLRDDRHDIYMSIKSMLDLVILQISQGQYETAVQSWIEMFLYAIESAGLENPLENLLYQEV